MRIPEACRATGFVHDGIQQNRVNMLIESFHSGRRGRRRYTSLHRPQTRLVKSAGVVLCHPLGHEYYRAYRAYVKLANSLAEAGFPVLRFDYAGTGDAEGDGGYAGLDDWLNDIREAAADLERNESVNRIVLGGMRFGGTLAALAAHRIPNVTCVLLWDAIDDGGAYLDALRALHAEMLDDQERFPYPRKADECVPTELIGTIYPRRLLDEIDTVSLDPKAGTPQFIRASSRNAPQAGRREWRDDIQGNVDYGWLERHRLEESIVDPHVVKSVAARLNAAIA